ncbi:MAG: hypothetical protein J6O49_17120 [Bacteroidaceae bacterium]|nr:hypothetical protein [Bacteroidaceae bacterium]
MKEIFVLIDYKGHFGSKSGEYPYRGGFCLDILSNAFLNYGYKVITMEFSEVDLRDNWKGRIVLYTSQEDIDYLYKSYIEDVIYGLEQAGAFVIPKFKYLRCNNNKVFMEMLRDVVWDSQDPLHALTFGCVSELENAITKERISFPCVIKSSQGACSYGVKKADNPRELLKAAKSLASSIDLKNDLHDFVRRLRHKGYIQECRFRKKFIVQPMIEGLSNDWKVLVFNNQYYTLIRHVNKNDFRGSGSHNDYRLGGDSGIPEEVLNHAKEIYEKLDVPMISLDMAFDGKRSYLIEFQTVYFGSWTCVASTDYYEYNNGAWILKKKSESIYEKIYAQCIVEYLNK